MSPSSGTWEAREEQPKPAIDDEGWASGDTTAEPNYDGWGTLEKQPDPIASKRSWKAVFSRKSSRNIMNDIHCTKCKKSFSSTIQIDKHACEGAAENGHIMSKGDENTTPLVNYSDSIYSDKRHDSEEGATTGNCWEDVGDNVNTEKDHNKQGRWSAPGDNASYQDTIPEKQDVRNGKYKDYASEEASDQDVHPPPAPAWKDKPKRNVRTSPYKERYEALLAQGWLTHNEVALLITCEGRDLITHLRHFELVASMRSSDGACQETPETPQDASPEYPYSAVHVLLLHWEESDLAADGIVEELMSVCMEWFGFESAESFHIPSERSYEALETRIQDFKRQYSSEKNLLIVYYAGHGFLDAQNRMHWAAKE